MTEARESPLRAGLEVNQAMLEGLPLRRLFLLIARRAQAVVGASLVSEQGGDVELEIAPELGATLRATVHPGTWGPSPRALRGSPAGPARPPYRWVMPIDVDAANFDAEVLQRSASVPVVVDFWAAWCGPCRQLGPVLERAVEARDGQVVLAKLDTDANPDLAQRYQIRGIPAVKAFRDGAVVEEFVGAQPRAAVDAFLDRIVPNEVDGLVAAGDEASLRRAVELDPARVDAALPLARLLHARGENEAALALLHRVPGSFAADGLAAQIELEAQAVPELEPAWRELSAGRAEAALDLLLSALPGAGSRKDLLRRVVIGLLDGMQPGDAGAYRRRLASALY